MYVLFSDNCIHHNCMSKCYHPLLYFFHIFSPIILQFQLKNYHFVWQYIVIFDAEIKMSVPTLFLIYTQIALFYTSFSENIVIFHLALYTLVVPICHIYIHTKSSLGCYYDKTLIPRFFHYFSNKHKGHNIYESKPQSKHLHQLF